MRILIVSDIHGNLESLAALPRDYDELWVLGDLVNYGPNPAEVIRFVRANASLVVRGNHDDSAGFNADPKCSVRFKALAQATGELTNSVLTGTEREYLRSLPTTVERTVEGVRFYACHAVPSDPLFTYCAPDSQAWEDEIQRIDASVLLAGHTHLPFVRRIGDRTIVNPGSLGQPKNSQPLACYALWRDGRFELCSSAYQVELTIQKIREMPVAEDIRDDLAKILATGCAPPPR